VLGFLPDPIGIKLVTARSPVSGLSAEPLARVPTVPALLCAASGADSAGTGESPFIGLKPRQQQRSTSRAPLRLIAMGARRAHPGLAGGQMRRTPPQPYGPAAKPTARTQVPRQPDSVGYQRFSRPAPMPDKPATPSNSQVQSADLSACSQVE